MAENSVGNANVDDGKDPAKRPLSLKKCSECGLAQPVARRKCSDCSSIFKRKVKNTAEILKNKGETNPTDQKKMMESRADILHHKHNCDIVILTHKRHGLGYTISTYGTEGFAQMFIGTHSSDRSEEGQAIVTLFDRFMAVQKNKKKEDEKRQMQEQREKQQMQQQQEQPMQQQQQPMQQQQQPMQQQEQAMQQQQQPMQQQEQPMQQQGQPMQQQEQPMQQQEQPMQQQEQPMQQQQQPMQQQQQPMQQQEQPMQQQEQLMQQQEQPMQQQEQPIQQQQQPMQQQQQPMQQQQQPMKQQQQKMQQEQHQQQLQQQTQIRQSTTPLNQLQQQRHQQCQRRQKQGQQPQEQQTPPLVDQQPVRYMKLAVPNQGYLPNHGDNVLVIGKQNGKAKLFGTATIIPGRQLHFRQMREDSSKVAFSALSVKDGVPFYSDKHGEDSLAVGQLYEWPNTYLFPLNNPNQ